QSLGAQVLQRVVIVGAAGDGLGEDGGVRGDAGDAVLVDEALELAGGDQAAADKIEPDGLAEAFELEQGAALCGSESVHGAIVLPSRDRTIPVVSRDCVS